MRGISRLRGWGGGAIGIHEPKACRSGIHSGRPEMHIVKFASHCCNFSKNFSLRVDAFTVAGADGLVFVKSNYIA